jgi:hypothetical protein
MTSPQGTGPPVLVPLAAEIDMTTCDQLSAAFTRGALVVVADFTLTTFCDSATLRRLLAIHRQAATPTSASPSRCPARSAGSCQHRQPHRSRPSDQHP